MRYSSSDVFNTTTTTTRRIRFVMKTKSFIVLVATKSFQLATMILHCCILSLYLAIVILISTRTITINTTTNAYSMIHLSSVRTHSSRTAVTNHHLYRYTTNTQRDRVLMHSSPQSSDNVQQIQVTNDNDDMTTESTTTTTTSMIPTITTNSNSNNNVGWIHGVTSKSGPLNEAVLTILHNNNHPSNNNSLHRNYHHYTLQDVNELIEIGAVWAKMETLSNDEILSLYDDNNDNAENDARYLYADLPKGWGSGSNSDDPIEILYVNSNNNKNKNMNTNEPDEGEDDLDAYIETMSQQRYRRILTPSSITAGIDIRVYPQPRRFTTACQSIQSTNLLYEDTTFIVIDKPPMLPTQPDASNYIECCPSCVNTQLGPFYDILGNVVTRPLLCHRIDTCVGGVVVLSKDTNGQKVFHQYQRQRQLRKMYYAVTTQPVPTGQHIHWMWAKQSSRRRGSGTGGGSSSGPPCQLVRHSPPDSRRIARTYWNRCVLEVVHCIPIQIDPKNLSSTSEEGEPPPQYYQSTIRLVTGRKHQVRAQLASLGCPILYDTLYGPIAGYTYDDLEDSEEEMERQISKCRIPTQPIGLQAAGILFGGIKVRANTPWWG